MKQNHDKHFVLKLIQGNLYILNETAEYETEEFEILLLTDQIDDNKSIYAVTYRSVLPEGSEEVAVFVNHMFEKIKKAYGDPDTFEGRCDDEAAW